MMLYSIEPRDRIFVTGYRFFPFLKNLIKNLSKNLSKKCSQKLLNQAKKSVTDTIKTNQKSN